MTTFTGWVRSAPKSPWVQVCQAADYWGCWELLLKAIGKARHVEAEVLPEGERPTKGEKKK